MVEKPEPADNVNITRPSRWELFDDWLWETNWYPFLWDHTYGPFSRLYKNWRFNHDLAAKFGGKIPQVGDMVCTCTYMHGTIISKRNRDDVVVEDANGRKMGCSLWNCCDPIDHDWQHPSNEEMAAWHEETRREIEEYERSKRLQ